MMKEIIKNIRFFIREEMGRHVLLYPFFKLKKKPQARLISKKTEIVIEGLQRSGNTYMVAYFKLTNPDVVYSSHYHFLSQILVATKKKLPTIVLIRNPQDTVPSFLMRDPFVNPKQVLKYTINFFTRLNKLKNRVVISDFSKTIKDPHLVIQEINQKFQTNFKHPEVDDELKQKITRLVEEMDKISRDEDTVDELMVSRPSTLRADAKKEVMEKVLLDNSTLLCEAENSYRKVI
jgi:hypothetical protein